MEINSLPFEENEILHRAVIKHEIKEESNLQTRLVLPRGPAPLCRLTDLLQSLLKRRFDESGLSIFLAIKVSMEKINLSYMAQDCPDIMRK